MIEFWNVTKLYGKVIGINDVSINIENGAYGLLGPNGSGKTTFVNLLLGQLRPTIGSVRVFGHDPAIHDSVLRKIGLCPTADILIPSVSAFAWVTYLTEMHGFSASEAADRAESALKRVGMSEVMRRNIGTFSLGMRQRTKLAQAIAHDPELLILDEPFNGLDPVGRHQMSDFLHDWLRSKRSVLLASHILHEVEMIDPVILLMSGGRLLASGKPGELRDLLMEADNEIEIEVNDVRAFSLTMQHLEPVLACRVLDDRTVAIRSADPAAVFAELPRLVVEKNYQIFAVRSRDESLHDLFTALIRRHRGEE